MSVLFLAVFKCDVKRIKCNYMCTLVPRVFSALNMAARRIVICGLRINVIETDPYSLVFCCMPG